jgi:hypothetical protein
LPPSHLRVRCTLKRWAASLCPSHICRGLLNTQSLGTKTVPNRPPETRYLLRYNCFGPIMVVFFENGERYNLLYSAVLDLIDYIRRENIKPILDHLVSQPGVASHGEQDVSHLCSRPA